MRILIERREFSVRQPAAMRCLHRAAIRVTLAEDALGVEDVLGEMSWCCEGGPPLSGQRVCIQDDRCSPTVMVWVVISADGRLVEKAFPERGCTWT